MLHFRTDCRHRDLRRLKAEAQSRTFVGIVGKRDQVFRKIVEFSVDYDLRLFIRQIADVRKRDAQVIAGGADVSAVKIAGVVKLFRIDVDEGIVVRGVELFFNPLPRNPKRIAQNAVYLRRAANGIAVLNFDKALFKLRVADGADAFEQVFVSIHALRVFYDIVNIARAFDLSRVIFHLRDFFSERHFVAAHDLRSRCGDEIADIRKPPRPLPRKGGDGRHHRRTVHDRKSFFRRKRKRGDSFGFERVDRRNDFPFVIRFALSHNDGSHIGQRRQIARCADRSQFGDHGNDIFVEQGFEHFGEDDSDRRMPAFYIGVQSAQYNGASFFVRKFFTEPDAVKAHDGLLQLCRA